MEEQTSKKQRFSRELWEWGKALLIALVAAVFITQVVIVNAQIPSESMENTIMVGDRVIGFRLSYLFSSPERGDIIIFRYPDDESQLYIKRVIGLPGDTVAIKDGEIYINQSPTPLEDSYVTKEFTGSFGPYSVPEGHYFVMGDNRTHSWDSRYWQNTYVAEDKILGKAIFRLFPNPGAL